MVAAVLLSVAGGMVGLAFASVPLYRLFCQVTGYGGTPRIAVIAKDAPATERTITIRFDSNIGGGLPWRFQPEQRETTARPGEPILALYRAKNLSDTPMLGTATFNVTPFKAAPYFAKIDCFCFVEQRLAPGEEASMPVSFYVDPEIFDDPKTRDVRTITLSYTFFRATEDDAADDGPDVAAGGAPPAGPEGHSPAPHGG